MLFKAHFFYQAGLTTSTKTECTNKKRFAWHFENVTYYVNGRIHYYKCISDEGNIDYRTHDVRFGSFHLHQIVIVRSDQFNDDGWSRRMFLSIKDCLIRYLQNISFIIQCPPLNRITLGQYKSDNNHRMIQFTDVFCVQGEMGLVISYYDKQLILLYVIQLSGGHSIDNAKLGRGQHLQNYFILLQ